MSHSSLWLHRATIRRENMSGEFRVPTECRNLQQEFLSKIVPDSQ